MSICLIPVHLVKFCLTPVRLITFCLMTSSLEARAQWAPLTEPPYLTLGALKRHTHTDLYSAKGCTNHRLQIQLQQWLLIDQVDPDSFHNILCSTFHSNYMLQLSLKRIYCHSSTRNKFSDFLTRDCNIVSGTLTINGSVLTVDCCIQRK